MRRPTSLDARLPVRYGRLTTSVSAESSNTRRLRGRLDRWRDRLDGERRSKGDDAAFDALVDRHAAAIHRLAVAIVGPDEAPDVTQDVLVLAWQRLPQLRDPSLEAAWLRRIVVNRCLDRGRASSRRVRTIPMTDPDYARLRSMPGPSTDGFDPVIDAAVRRLPVEQRAVIALHYAADLAIADVAAALKVPVGTAKSRLAAALERLRLDLEEAP
jgi:RNA polymerase sigma-70 factor, ECF subfamily